MEKATFAAGCFWGVEHEFRKMKGVQDAVSGYTGGHLEQPTYQDVCSDRTGHAEAVEVTYDPEQISYEELIEAFWKIHDPTTLNRQGPDVGDQYRSAVFTHSPEQQEAASASKEKAQERFGNGIVTEVESAEKFWPAEDYHQRYFEKRGIGGH